MKSQRLDMIEEYVLEHKNASLDTLCEKFNVSKNTIRRDVDILLKRGSIMKVRYHLYRYRYNLPEPG